MKEQTALKENKNVKMMEVINKYLVLNAHLKPATFKNAVSRISKWIDPYFDELNVEDVDSAMLIQWIEWLKTKLSATAIQEVVFILKEIMDVGVNCFGLKENVAKRLKLRLCRVHKSSDLWTRDEFEFFIDKVSDLHFHVFYTMLFNTGMRLEEILALQYKDVNLSTGSVIINKDLDYIDGEYVLKALGTFEGKRIVYLDRRALFEFQYYIKNVGSHKAGDRIFDRSLDSYKNYLTAVCTENNLKPINLFEFRRSFISELVEERVPIKYVNNWLGYRSDSTFETYSEQVQEGSQYILKLLNGYRCSNQNWGESKNVFGRTPSDYSKVW